MRNLRLNAVVKLATSEQQLNSAYTHKQIRTLISNPRERKANENHNAN